MKAPEATTAVWTRSRCLRNGIRREHLDAALVPLRRLTNHAALHAPILRNGDGSTTILTEGMDGGVRIALGSEIVFERVRAGAYAPDSASMRLSLPTRRPVAPIPMDDAAARTAMAHLALAAVSRLVASSSARQRMPIDDEDRLRIAVRTVGAAAGATSPQDMLRLPSPWAPPALIPNADPIDPLADVDALDVLELRDDARRVAMALLPRGWVLTYDGRPDPSAPQLRIVVRPLVVPIGVIDPTDAMRRIAALGAATGGMPPAVGDDGSDERRSDETR